MFIEGISLEQFSAKKQPEKETKPQALTCHAVFHYFLYDDRKYYADTTIERINLIVE